MSIEASTIRNRTFERDYPQMAALPGRVEPAPRRVRAYLDGQLVFDTIRARYVWEWSNYPQYYVPLADIDTSLLVDEDHEQRLRFGTARQGQHGTVVVGIGGDVEEAHPGSRGRGGRQPRHHLGAATLADIGDALERRLV